MVKLIPAQNRLFKNLFLCKNCSARMKVDSRKIIEGKVKCRRCGKKAFRAIKKGKK